MTDNAFVAIGQFVVGARNATLLQLESDQFARNSFGALACKEFAVDQILPSAGFVIQPSPASMGDVVSSISCP